MIQRIQTLYLIGAILMFVLMMCFPLGYFMVGNASSPLSIFGVHIGPEFHNTLAISLILFLSVFCEMLAIGMFKNRALQMRLITFNSLLQVAFYIALVAYVLLFKGEFKTVYSLSWAVFLPLVTIVLNILAYKAIHKDEALVRSLNHLR